uniref:Flavin-containing monooxygenase n=1 Tax=Globodera pallida TaxID=36090 RepID=A0A183BS14_GLOPA
MKVLIIGAGASGLPSLKTALEYGLDAVCLEKSSDIGGLWRYKDNPAPGEGTVMKSTVINSSKEMSAYSDFPPPREAANYMHNREMLNYLRSYAANFDLIRHIQFNTEVLNVQRVEDFEKNGKWTVTYRKTPPHSLVEGGEEQKVMDDVFDGVMVCTGHHCSERWPNPPFPGQSVFRGQILHSRAFHTAKPFEDQTVVVVGIGNSGGDIAVELSKVAKQVYLATRTGSWVINRVWEKGHPTDAVLLNRFAFALRAFTPRSVQNDLIERKLNFRFDHERYGLRPSHRFLEAHVTVNDELPNRIASGTMVVKPNIQKLAEKEVTFDDGTTVNGVDTVIFATGYNFFFPQLEGGRLIPVQDNKALLYKLMFPHELSPQPTGSIMPISEMQARLFCAQLTGDIKLPQKTEMVADALAQMQKIGREFVNRPRHTIQVQYVDYMDELAKLVGCKPKLARRVFADPSLAKLLLFNGLVPYQFRLDGPHQWEGARKAILEMDERMYENTRTRRKTKEGDKGRRKMKKMGGGLGRALSGYI